MIEKIFQWNPPQEAQHFIVVVLVWIGFSVLIGLIAQFIVPIKKNKGAVSALVIGLTSSCLGSMLVSRFHPDKTFNPIGIVGFAVSLVIAILLLILFHVFLFLFPLQKNEENKDDNQQTKL